MGTANHGQIHRGGDHLTVELTEGVLGSMERREFLKTSVAALLLAREGRANTSASRPNVLFVMSDDMNNDFGGVAHLADVKCPTLTGCRVREFASSVLIASTRSVIHRASRS